MWIHTGIFLGFCVLFLFSKGFFSKSGDYLAGHLPKFIPLTKKEISSFLMILFCCNLLGLAYTAWQSGGKDTVSEGYLLRPGQGEGSYKEELVVSDGEHQKKIAVEVLEEPYSGQELEDMLKQALQTLEQTILGKNKSAERIEYPMHLITSVPDTPITVEWNSSQPIYLDWEGHLGEEIPEQGAKVRLSAVLTAGEYIREYEKELTVFPEKLSPGDALARKAEKEAKEYGKQEGRYQYLPEEIAGKQVHWSRPASHTGFMITGFGALIGGLLIASGQSRKRQKEKDEKMQMLLDYPGIINKLILLMQAGVSSRRAIKKIALDYKCKVDKDGGKRRAYEEILGLYYEMERGISEQEAYEHLGQRCCLPEYRTLSTLLVQNLKKGSTQFIQVLQRECIQAFEERKKRALILGEEAGTKLLLPMAGMLLLVLLILMVPSFLSF